MAISTLTLVSIVVNVLTLATEGRRPAGDWRLAAVLLAWFVPGAVGGALVLDVASQTVVEVLVAVGVLAAIGARLLPASRGIRLPAVPAGLLSGAFGMSTGLSGPPLIIHMLHTGLAPLRMRDTLAAIFLAQAFLGLAILAVVGVLAFPGALPLLFAAAAAGHVLGRRVFGRMGPVAYERVVLATMAASAVSTLVLLAT
ncbi:MAG: hypothetical protein JWO90_947 [Solirubrobacterales bacterium]|nr:hypothetical protein [Solirubrobacterales bacterium]